MPELPEVETVCQDLIKAGLNKRRIQGSRFYWEKTLSEPGLNAFNRVIKGKRILNIRRRAKYIVISLDSPWHLLIHLRMTGRLDITDSKKTLPYERARIVLDKGALSFIDIRKFGRILLTDNLDESTSHLGVEPLSDVFTRDYLKQSLHKRQRDIKGTLLDQSIIAGIGNIYADESLWLARIHPQTPAGRIKVGRIDSLHQAIRSVLKTAIKNAGTSLGDSDLNYYSVSGRRGRHQDGLQIFRKNGQPCPRCQTVIIKTVVAQRGTHLCPKCQLKKP